MAQVHVQQQPVLAWLGGVHACLKGAPPGGHTAISLQRHACSCQPMSMEFYSWHAECAGGLQGALPVCLCGLAGLP